MAQFDILQLAFHLPPQDDQPAELKVYIDNPQGMEVDTVQQGVVPDDVEVVPQGEEPTSEYWVYADHHHLTITLKAGDGNNPLEVDNTGFYNEGQNQKYLDIVIAAKDGDDKKKTKQVRNKGIVISI